MSQGDEDGHSEQVTSQRNRRSRRAVHVGRNARVESGPRRPTRNVQVPRNVVKGTVGLSQEQKELQDKISDRGVYIRKLEEAIAELQRTISPEEHPLLQGANNLVPGLEMDEGNSPPESTSRPDTPHDDTDTMAEFLGMLSLEEDPYHSVIAASEHLVKMTQNNKISHRKETTSNNEIIFSPLSFDSEPGLLLHSCFFPLPPCDQQRPQMNSFLKFLPGYTRASFLVSSYLYFFSWVAMPVPKHDLELLFSRFYPGNVLINDVLRSDAHKLGVLFMIFSIGTLYDVELNKSTLASKTREYYCLSRAALAADPLTENTTLPGVQAIMLMIWYFRFFPGIENLGFQWALLGLLNKHVQAIGLHRDKAVCMLWPEQQQEYIPLNEERRLHEQTFWEFNALDIWQTSMLGRPTSLSMTQVDCHIPLMVDAPRDLASSYYIWRYSFSRLVSEVSARVSGTTEGRPLGKTKFVAAEYKDILLLENRLKKHYIPEDLAWPEPDEPLPQNEPIGKTFQRFISYVWFKVSIMYLHKEFFYKAVNKDRIDPTKNRYWRSVKIVYNTSSRLVLDTRRLWYAHRTIIDRMCPFWSHLHSAAVNLGTLVTKSPGCEFARDALGYLDMACDLFKTATNSLQPPDALPHLLETQRNAHRNYKRFHDTGNQFESTVESQPSSMLPSRAQSPFGVPLYPMYMVPAIYSCVQDAGRSGLEHGFAAPLSSLNTALSQRGYATILPENDNSGRSGPWNSPSDFGANGGVGLPFTAAVSWPTGALPQRVYAYSPGTIHGCDDEERMGG